MSLHLKRTVLFFCVFYLGLVGCLGNTAIAKTYNTFLGGVFKEYVRLRVVSGTVRCNGTGLQGVEIYDGNKWLGESNSQGFYSVQITQGLPTTLTPVKTGYQFNPPSIVIPSDQDDHPYQSFDAIGACPPMQPTLISPLGTIYSSTPTFKWVGPMNAKYYNLLVVGSLENTQYGYTEIEAGCSSGSANCSVTPPKQLADGSYSWSVRACLNAGYSSCGGESSFMSFIVSAGPYGGTIDLPWTGQTKCYNSLIEISCTGTGQDGELQKGFHWYNPRFTVSGDCVTDGLTSLMWAKNGIIPTFGRFKTWQGALDYVASINSGAGLCGYHDWRLPNVNALESLVNAGEADSAAWLNSQGFTNVTSSTYWSSTTSARNTSNAWTVLMGMGQSGAMGKSGTIDVWPVRSTSGIFKSVWQTGQKASYAARDDGALPEGHDWPSPRFQNYSDGTTFDHLTGLMWSKNANLPNGRKTWSAALAYVKTLNTGGHSDWRLPNREELFSLIDRSKYSPAVLVSSSDPEFQNIQTDYYYWSSTTELSHPDYAFTVDMGDGIVDRGYKNNTFYVWPVR